MPAIPEAHLVADEDIPRSAPEPKRVPLDDATIAMLQELQQAAQQQQAFLEGQRQGALLLFMKQKGLTGKWGIAPNGRELIQEPSA